MYNKKNTQILSHQTKMLSQSEIFNRLPISDEQKAELYKILISERHTELDRLAASSKTPAVPTDHSQAETMAMDESPEELESAQPSEKA